MLKILVLVLVSLIQDCDAESITGLNGIKVLKGDKARENPATELWNTIANAAKIATDWSKHHAAGLACLVNAGFSSAASLEAAPVVAVATITACVCQHPEFLAVLTKVALLAKDLCPASTKVLGHEKPEDTTNFAVKLLARVVCSVLKNKDSLQAAKQVIDLTKCNEGAVGGFLCAVSVASGVYAAKSVPALATVVGSTGAAGCLCGQPELLKTLKNVPIVGDVNCSDPLVAGFLCLSTQLAGAGTAGTLATPLSLSGFATCYCSNPKLVDFLKDPTTCQVAKFVSPKAKQSAVENGCKRVAALGADGVEALVRETNCAVASMN